MSLSSASRGSLSTQSRLIDAVIYPDGCNCCLLLPLHQNLHLPEAHNHTLCQCSSQERPWSLHSVPTICTTMPDGWCSSSEIAMSGAGGFFWASLAVFLHSLLGRTMAPVPVTGDAGRLSWTTAPHITQAIAAHLFLAKVQVLHCQRLREEEAMVIVVCAVFQHIFFFALTHTGGPKPA